MRGTARTMGQLGIALSLAAGLVLSAHPALGQTDQPVVVQVELTGVVDPIVADHIVSAVDRANADGAAAVLLTIDTPGGLGSSMDEIDQALLNSAVPVIGYVSPIGARAASAGAFILLSCPVAAMAPGTNIGASTPIGLSGGDLAKKIQNDAQASIRKLAQTYGRNEDVAESFVTDAVSITAEEALADGVIDLIAPTTDELLADLDGQTVTLGTGATTTLHTANATIETDPLGAFLGLLHNLLDPNLAFIFFWLGLALIVLELFTPGGVLGTLGALMLVSSFVALGALPFQIIGVVLLIASVVFFVLELKHPGIGVPAIGGVTCLVLGGVYLFDASVPSARVSPLVIAPTAAFALLFFGVVVRAAIRMRHQGAVTRDQTLVGREAVVVRDLDPVGDVRVGSEEWTAETAGPVVEKGARVRVVEMEGIRLKVTSAEEPASATADREGGAT